MEESNIQYGAKAPADMLYSTATQRATPHGSDDSNEL